MPADRQMVLVEEAKPPFFAGVDVGGTNTKIGVVDDLGKTLCFASIPTVEEQGPEDAVRRFHRTLDGLLTVIGISWEAVNAVGLGSPGSMDIAAGMILEPPNMPNWRYFPIRDRLAERCDKPVTFANDANAAAFGEYWVGSGRQFSSMVMFTLGTGVGGGIILNEFAVDGEHSFGSELGHTIIDQRENARMCVWGGGKGELEAYASAPAVVARIEELLDAGHASSLRKRLDSGERLTTLMLAEEAEQGDALSLEVVLETARLLGIGVVSVVHTVDPGAVILGGAMNFGGTDTGVGRRFLERVRHEFRERAYHVVRDCTVIDVARLGGDAGYIGAAGIARAAHSSERR
jgi:glucokinase